MENLKPYRNVIILMALTACMILTGCRTEHKYKIGVSQCSTDDWRRKMNEEIVREAMFHDNLEVEIRSAEDNSSKQIADLDYFVNNGFDIIIVAPNEAGPLTPKINEIYGNGTPVVVFDRTINNHRYTAFRGADNALIGTMAANMAGTLAESPRILEIKGLKGSSPAELRHAGFAAQADSLHYEVLGGASGNWIYEQAALVTDSLLSLFPQTNVIYCHNDRMALGAADVTNRLGRDDIRIIGIDGAPALGIKAVMDGDIDVTFIYPTNGHELIRTAVDILEGKPFEPNLIYPTVSPVDSTNAEILMLQDKTLRDETDKISKLQKRMDVYTERFAIQTNIMYAGIVIIILFVIVIFLMLRTFRNNRRHRAEIEARANELARQRNELDAIYHQLQEATGSKLTFFTNVSHDLRTPLTLIADPIHRICGSANLSPEERVLMKLADKNVKRMQRLINQILDLRKYDSGQLKLNLVNIELVAALREWMAPFGDLARSRHIKFNLDLPANEKIVLALDVEKSERILFNLLSNAFKFTRENGAITVSLRRVGENAVIKVADTGCGIPQEEINLIFERFFKTDKINPNGSGIGLALSKVFIDMHGGSISVESDTASGSVFTVSLPIRTAGVSERQVTIPARQVPDVSEIEEDDDDDITVAEDAPSVLVIDDNHDICSLVRSILADKYTVLTASTGWQGLKIAIRYIPDLVICDVMMPGMDGYQVCRSLKEEPLTSHIPVLLLTACSRDEQRREGYDCGADAFMSKPFESETLMSRCNSLIANRQLIYRHMNAGRQLPAGEPLPAEHKIKNAYMLDDFLARFETEVEARISDSELSVESMSEILGISRAQLYRKIKATTNCSVTELMRIIRLKKASTLLKTTSDTVSEVAYAVGFSSPSYFSRCYKDYFGEPPVETLNKASGNK